MEFCNNCDNMLYVRDNECVEDVEYFCKYCNFTKSLSNKSKMLSSTTYNNNDINFDSMLNINIEYDKSIPHVNHILCINEKTNECSKPKNLENDVMYIKYDHKNMNYIYYCTYCKTFWKQNGTKINTSKTTDVITCIDMTK